MRQLENRVSKANVVTPFWVTLPKTTQTPPSVQKASLVREPWKSVGQSFPKHIETEKNTVDCCISLNPNLPAWGHVVLEGEFECHGQTNACQLPSIEA
jgi:hypothetical protein